MRCFLGFDAHEMQAHVVAAFSLRARSSVAVDVERLAMSPLQARGLYRRPTERVGADSGAFTLWDVRSGAPMTTSHAIARFFVPILCQHRGWALFADGDILVRRDIAELFALADPSYAVMVVKHPTQPVEALKKEGVVQTAYARKNWSSVMLWNCAHPANQALTLDVLNEWPGRTLHAFRWLTDDLIGPLPAGWNYLVGVSPELPDADVALAHYTLGCPNLDGHADDRFAAEWFHAARGAGYKVPTVEAV